MVGTCKKLFLNESLISFLCIVNNVHGKPYHNVIALLCWYLYICYWLLILNKLYKNILVLLIYRGLAVTGLCTCLIIRWKKSFKKDFKSGDECWRMGTSTDIEQTRSGHLVWLILEHYLHLQLPEWLDCP